jgi:Predicted integral membrane protein
MDCDVIKDLLPLYIEKLTSESSNELVEEHIKNCENCKELLLNLSEDTIIEDKTIELNKKVELSDNIIKRIRKHMYEKIILSILIALVLGIIIGVFRDSIFYFWAFMSYISMTIFFAATLASVVIVKKKYSGISVFKSLSKFAFIFSMLISIITIVIIPSYFNEIKKIQYLFLLLLIFNIILYSTLKLYVKIKLPKSKEADSRLFTVIVSTLVFIFIVVTIPAYMLEKNRIVGNVNLSFVNDPEVIGKWETVDFIKNIDQFDIKKETFKDPLLKEITFFEEGKIKVQYNKVTDNNGEVTPWMCWTKGYVIDKGGDQTTSKYIIKDINGSKYMFYEFKNGDYLYFHREPRYFVLKKVDN